MPDTDSAPKLDDETTAALTLYNEYVDADRERTQREKRIKKAERAKDEAAAAVKKLAERGSAEEKAEAEAAYRDAADRWKKLRDGEEPDEAPKAAPEAAAEEASTEDDPADGSEPDEVDEGAPAGEAAADEAPAEEAPAEEASTEAPAAEEE